MSTTDPPDPWYVRRREETLEEYRNRTAVRGEYVRRTRIDRDGEIPKDAGEGGSR